MDDRLNSFKKAMNRTIYKDMRFSSTNQEVVKARLKQQISAKDLTMYLLQSLQSESKTGYEVMLHLEQLGINHFNLQEGELYQLLHQMELDQMIDGEWSNDESKHYQITKKGLKKLKQIQQEKYDYEFRFSKQEGWT